ncbi:MAG: DUF3341 domain-containing protein [Tepidisphaeraceae bacterium]
MVKHAQPLQLFGMAAVFGSQEAVVEAAKQVHERGFRRAEAYTPYPIEELPKCFKRPPSKVPLISLIGALVGGGGAFGMMWYACSWSYRLDIGGKPPFSWPAFIPITFELAVLFAGLSAVFGMLALCGLPQPYHPMFKIPSFRRASRDRFFLCIEAKDPLFDRETTRTFLESFQPLSVVEVPR